MAACELSPDALLISATPLHDFTVPEGDRQARRHADSLSAAVMPVRVTLSQRGNITNVLEKRFAQMNALAPEVLGEQAVASIQAPGLAMASRHGLEQGEFLLSGAAQRQRLDPEPHQLCPLRRGIHGSRGKGNRRGVRQG